MTEPAYTGADNLESMADARNYTAFLVAEVLSASGGAATAVDFGAGSGTFAWAMRSRGLRVTCVEADQQLRQRLRQQGFECHAGLAQLPEGSCDYIFSLNVLEHIADDDAALAVLYRCLKPGGRFYLYVPAFSILFSSMDRKVGHCRRYRLKPLAAKLRKAGFRVLESRYADSLGFFATLLYRLVGNRHGGLNPRGLRLYDREAFPISRLLDRFLGRVLGKNVAVLAVRPAVWGRGAFSPAQVKIAEWDDAKMRPVPFARGA